MGISEVVIIDLIKIQKEAIRLAVQESPERGIEFIAERFEDAGVEDEDTRSLLDEWWKAERLSAWSELLEAARDTLPTECINPKEMRLQAAIWKLERHPTSAVAKD